MKIDLTTIDREQFKVDPHDVCGETMYLVQPQSIACKWNQTNKIFRSSLWNHEGNLISAGFPKFTNWGENPEHFPTPRSLTNCVCTEKIDGSLLVVSKYKKNWILRTRGTVDASKLENGNELEIFKREILSKIDDGEQTWNYSFLFEWTSPNNQIVIRYSDVPTWKLVGHVLHNDYSLVLQSSLDHFARIYNLERPEIFNFSEIDELLVKVEEWKGKEGVVIYSNEGQSLHKVKSAWYLALHRMKEALSSVDKVIDVWYSLNEPSYQEFEKYITEKFDWELWTQIRGEVSRILDASKNVDKIIGGMLEFVSSIKSLPTRKEQAQRVLSSYGNTNRSGFVFKLLDGKTLLPDDKKKLLYQSLK